MKKKCPLCNGKGYYEKKVPFKTEMIKRLYSMGFSIPKIMEMTGKKSTSTIHYHIHKN